MAAKKIRTAKKSAPKSGSAGAAGVLAKRKSAARGDLSPQNPAKANAENLAPTAPTGKARRLKKPARKPARSEPVAKAGSARKSAVARRAKATRAMSKKDFVESMLATTAASDVVLAAKRRGMTLTAKHVYAIRSDQRRASDARSSATPKTRAAATRFGTQMSKKAIATGGNVPHAATSEARFVELVSEIGLGRANALLSEFRSKVRSIRVG